MSGRKTSRSRAPVLAAAIAASAATAAFGATHVRLVNEGDPGPLYECGATACQPARVDDPSRQNRLGMDFYVLPDGCVELGRAVLRPDGPGVDVECGPPESSTTYRCEAGACLPAAPDDGAPTWPIALPSACGGRIHELIVLRVSADAPRVYVECDASSGPVGEM
jgi:hypothetical protein